MRQKTESILMLTGHQRSEHWRHTECCWWSSTTHTHHNLLLLDPSLALATLNSASPALHNHSGALQRMVSTTCTNLLSSLHVSSLSYTPQEGSAAERKFQSPSSLSLLITVWCPESVTPANRVYWLQIYRKHFFSCGQRGGCWHRKCVCAYTWFK